MLLRQEDRKSTFLKQPSQGGVGGNPWIYIQFFDEDWEPLTDLLLLGRCVQGLVPIDFAYGESGRSFSGVDPERHYPGVEGKHRMVRTAAWKLVRVKTVVCDEAGTSSAASNASIVCAGSVRSPDASAAPRRASSGEGCGRGVL